MSGWLSERSITGGVDSVPLPLDRGGLWLCGKHFVGPDVEAALRKTNASMVVCLNERHEIEDRYPDYARWLAGDHRALWHPIPDLGAPDITEAMALLGRLRSHVEHDETLLLHCGAGIGRAGTIAAGLLMTLGVPHDEALLVVQASRPLAGPEAGAQRLLLERLAGIVSARD